MISLKKLQQSILKNKIEKGFNTTDIYKEFCFTHEELSEAFRAYDKKLSNIGEELADVAIFTLGISEILKIDLEKEIIKKMAKNKKRVYQHLNGVTTRIKDA